MVLDVLLLCAYTCNSAQWFNMSFLTQTHSWMVKQTQAYWEKRLYDLCNLIIRSSTVCDISVDFLTHFFPYLMVFPEYMACFFFFLEIDDVLNSLFPSPCPASSPPPSCILFVAVAKTAEHKLLRRSKPSSQRGGSHPVLLWATHSVQDGITPEVEHGDGTLVIKWPIF